MRDPPSNENPILGLSSAEAGIRLRESGPNVVVPKRASIRFEEWKRILLDPMGLMLLGLSGLYALVGARKDSWMLLIAWVPITMVGVLLGLRADRALRALRGEIRSRVMVFRDGQLISMPVESLVPGDMIVLEQGQILPADGHIQRSPGILINEAALTGESVPVEKSEGDRFFCGTEVVSGSGVGRVEGTGQFTRFGRIASLVSETPLRDTPLQKDIQRLVRRLFLISMILAATIFIGEWIRGGVWTQALISSLTFAMSAVPEEFPIVFTLFLSLGALRLARHGVLVKALPSVETLGRVDVICTDKTGTLTEGKFRLVEVRPYTESGPADPARLARNARLACEEHPVDPMDQALVTAPATLLQEFQIGEWRLNREFPFDPTSKVVIRVWEGPSPEGGHQVVAMKGAVEGVVARCRLSEEARQRILTETDEIAQTGKRILGFGAKEGALPMGEDIAVDSGFVFEGLLVFEDPVRKQVKESLDRCRQAGIEIKILTGDHPGTALSVVRQLGMDPRESTIHVSSTLEKSGKEDHDLVVREGVIFARMSPEQKFHLVRRLKEQGKVVAMTGDGINDAPALRLADIGISMGEQATDVARSSAHLILMKNDFRGIIEAVLEGRRIFQNLKTSFSYLVAFHIPVFLLSLAPLYGRGERILLPIHIVLLELIVHPVSSLTFENRSVPIESQSPGPLIPGLWSAMWKGLMISIFAGALFYTGLRFGTEEARTRAFLGLLCGNIALILNEAGPIGGGRIGLTLGILTGIGLVVSRVQGVTALFHFSPLDIQEVIVILGLGFWIRARW